MRGGCGVVGLVGVGVPSIPSTTMDGAGQPCLRWNANCRLFFHDTSFSMISRVIYRDLDSKLI
ncbi:hypothetical protein KSP40_PGU016606 [Platanthera guangdongensis]|uniref:Uncharacterized protein n=1 Tax=Platanthera guangdongensis TaxID=2320717 RepID=A0ABR2LQT5_9ASPA